MKMSKLWTSVLLVGILACTATLLCQAAEDQPMNNAQFAGILANILGLAMPADAGELSDAEVFEVQANMLAEQGITLFVDAQPDGQVDRCVLANVLYDALIGPNEASITEKFNHLANLGYLTASPGYECDVMSSGEIITILNIPELSVAIAEAYSRAPRVAVRGAGIAPSPANPESEGLGSPALPLK